MIGFHGMACMIVIIACYNTVCIVGAKGPEANLWFYVPIEGTVNNRIYSLINKGAKHGYLLQKLPTMDMLCAWANPNET